MLLAGNWSRIQFQNLQNQLKVATSKVASIKMETTTQRVSLVPIKGDNGKDGVGIPGKDGTNAVSTNTIEVQTTNIKGDKGDNGSNGKDGRNGRFVEFCKFSDGNYGQRFVGDDECQPIETASE